MTDKEPLLEQLRNRIEQDVLFRNRNATVSIEDDTTLTVEEYGNPALTINDSNSPPRVEETGKPHLVNRIEDITQELFGHNEYDCSTNEEENKSRITVNI